jgi:hypothetical protein
MKRKFSTPTNIILVSGHKGAGKDTFSDFIVKQYGYTKVSFAARLKDIVAAKYNLDRASLDDQSQKELPIDYMPVVSKDDTSLVYQKPLITHFRTLEGKEPSRVHFPKEYAWCSKCKETNYQKYCKSCYAITYDKEGQLLWNHEPLFWTRRSLMVLEGCVGRTTNPNFWVDTVIPRECDNIIISDWRFENEYNRLLSILENCTLYRIRIDSVIPSTSTDPSERSLDNYSGFDTRILNTMNGMHIFIEKIQSNEVVSAIPSKKQKSD